MTERSNSSEPVLARAALRPFVQAAQNQTIAPTRLNAHEVQRAWAQAERDRQHTRKTLALGVGLGLTAAAIVAVIGVSLMGDRRDRERDDVATQVESDEPTMAPEIQPLDAAVRIRSDHRARPPRVLGPWSIALDSGSHRISVAAVDDRALRIELPERTLELVEGTMTIEVTDLHGAVVHLESGVAGWIDADGARTQIEVERIELRAGEPAAEPAAVQAVEPVASEPSATALAREAERKLLAGQRNEAIDLLRKLVRKHPRTPQARTALMDLAAQERLAGAPDRARCAYLLYLEQWPHSAVRAEIDKQLEKLGDGPECRGLDPR